jgi:hypothetical protein
MKPIAWYDPSNGMVSTDQDCPLFTPLGQVWGLYLKEEAKDEPWEKFCDSHCFWTDHHPDCKLAQRTWVGLTDEEIEVIEVLRAPPVHPDFVDCDDWVEFARAIEAKLKEKNT